MSDIDIQSLRCFVEVCRQGSYIKAAEELGRVQSTVSASIKKLEDSLGYDLFETVERRLSLTEKAREILPDVDRGLRDFDNLVTRCASANPEPKGCLRIASNITSIQHILPGAIRLLLEKFPGLSLKLTNKTSMGIERSLIEGKADLGIGFPMRSCDEIKLRLLFRTGFVLVAPRGLAAEYASVDPLRLPAKGFIHLPGGGPSGVFKHIWDHIQLEGESQAMLEMPSLDTILAYVEEGFGYSILPSYVVTAYWREQLDAFPLSPATIPEIDINIYWSAQRELTNAAKEMKSILFSGGDKNR